MRIAALVLLVPFALVSCKGTEGKQNGTASRPSNKATSRPTAKNGVDTRGRFDAFGAPLASETGQVVSSDTLVKDLSKYEGKTVRVSGVVESTCAKKGCWMNVGEGTNRVFVKFLDYAFFVPTSGAEGRPVVFEGVVSNKLMSVDEARHYAEDAGDYEAAKRITKPMKIPFVMATGVRMYQKS